MYPVDSVVCFGNTYPLDSDLSGEKRYPALEQLGPEQQQQHQKKQTNLKKTQMNKEKDKTESKNTK